jgi:hypothetical protein
LTYYSTTSETTVCHWCPVNCKRTFIDVRIHEGPGRPGSRVPLAEGWSRVIYSLPSFDADLLAWMFAADIRAGAIRSPLSVSDVWPSSYSSNANEGLWATKVAARLPWCVI